MYCPARPNGKVLPPLCVSPASLLSPAAAAFVSLPSRPSCPCPLSALDPRPPVFASSLSIAHSFTHSHGRARIVTYLLSTTIIFRLLSAFSISIVRSPYLNLGVTYEHRYLLIVHSTHIHLVPSPPDNDIMGDTAPRSRSGSIGAWYSGS